MKMLEQSGEDVGGYIAFGFIVFKLDNEEQ